MEKDLKDTDCPGCRRLAARLAISELLHRYCRAVDDRDDAAFDALWAPDAQADFGPRYRGAARGLLAWIAGNHAATRSMSHHMSGEVIALAEDLRSADSSCDVSALVVVEDEGGARWVRGRYHDRLVLHDGGWRIAHRRFEARQSVSAPVG